MNRSLRLVLFLLGAVGAGLLYVTAVLGMPAFGDAVHPFRDGSVAAAAAHATANVVSAINYDQRSLDTLGEETILLGAVLGVTALLRPATRERDDEGNPFGSRGRVLEATQLLGYVLLPATLLVGIDLVVHGHLTPGGGFQGGVVIATGAHLLYVAGRYPALQRIRPLTKFSIGEALGTGTFVVLGVVGLVIGGVFLTNVIAFGHYGELLSGGTVAVLSVAVGLEVAAGIIVLLARFLEQAITIEEEQ